MSLFYSNYRRMSLITGVCQCWNVSTVRFLIIFFHVVQQSISTEAISVWECYMVKVSHIYNLPEQKKSVRKSKSSFQPLHRIICFHSTLTNLCSLHWLLVLFSVCIQKLHVVLLGFFWLIYFVKAGDLFWPTVQRHQTNSLYYTWLPPTYRIISECK